MGQIRRKARRRIAYAAYRVAGDATGFQEDLASPLQHVARWLRRRFAALGEAEWARDPLPKLKVFATQLQIGEDQWSQLEREAEWQVEAARAEAESRGISPPERVTDMPL